MKKTFLNSGILFNIAVSAYERVKCRSLERTGGQDDALVAILFATATLEAFIKELSHFVASESTQSAETPLHSLSKLLDETDRFQATARHKYLLTKVNLRGKAYDENEQPFRDFACLFDLRDAIIHLRPEKLQGEARRIVMRFGASRTNFDKDTGMSESWLRKISTPAIARWACNLAIDMVESLVAYVPENSEKAPLLSIFLNSQFKRVS